MKILPKVLVFISLVFPFASPFALASSPKTTTRQLAREVLKVASENDSSRRNQMALKVTHNYFTFETFAQWTLEDYWNTLSAQQQDRFIHAFKKRFTQNVLDHLPKRTDKRFSLKIIKEYPEGGYTVVKCTLLSDGKKSNLELVWILEREKWHLVDVEVAKADLVANYKGQFNKIMREHGFEELLRRLENYLIH